MKFWRRAGMLFLVLSAGSAFGTPDPLWLFKDTTGLEFYNFRFCDTIRYGPQEYDCDELTSGDYPDTDSYDGSQYINFNYQFSRDSAYMLQAIYPCLSPHDSCGADTVGRYAPRPGYAGFKTAWDYGMCEFSLARYKYLVLAYKGPLPAHKVRIRFWYNNGKCGATSYLDSIGTLAASSTWKLDSIPIPDSFQNRPDSARNNMLYYEMVVLINNLDPNDTTSSPPGNFKIDNMRLAGRNPIDSSPRSQTVNVAEAVTFRVATSKADSTDILTYQWKKNGVAIVGAIDSVYTLDSATTVVTPPTITAQPASKTVTVGQPVTFTVTGTDAEVYTVTVTVSSTNLSFTSPGAALTVNQAPPLSYQWRKDGVPLTGDTLATKTITSVQAADAGVYTVVVKNAVDSVTSVAATLTVNSVQPQQPKKDNCGCGSGTGLALIPPLFFKAMAHRKRKKKDLKV